MEALQNSHEVDVPKYDMNEVGYHLPPRLLCVARLGVPSVRWA